MNDIKKICRVCGLYYQNFLPWGKDGKTPSHDICDSCGVEFGYEDNNLVAIIRYRQTWLKNGAKWFNKEKKPNNWNPRKQLKNIPKEFLGPDEKY